VSDRAEVEHLDDVRVVEPERDLGLVDEHRDELPAPCVRGVDLLDDEGLVEPLRHGGAGEEHLGHATSADLADQRVFAELLHSLEGHAIRTWKSQPTVVGAAILAHSGVITRLSNQVSVSQLLMPKYSCPAPSRGCGSS